MKSWIVTTFFLLSSSLVMAKDNAPCLDSTMIGGVAVSALASVADSMPSNCPNLSKLKGICVDISSKTTDLSNPEQYSYAYEKKIYEAACVDFTKDNAQIARQKLAALWDKHQDQFKCDSADFSVTQGSILKYAIEMKTYGFLDNAVKTWKLNLNYVDSSDKKTVLDYVETKLIQYRGTNAEPVLKNYYDILRRNGAKKSSELPASNT